MLQTVSFIQDTSPEFESLSYSCDSTDRLVNILIRVKEPRELAVTQDLATALAIVSTLQKTPYFLD